MQDAGRWRDAGTVAAARVIVAVAGAGDSDHVAWDAGDEGGEGCRDAEEELWETHCSGDGWGVVRGFFDRGRVVARATVCEGEWDYGEIEL